MRISAALVSFGLFLGSSLAFAGDLTPADYQFLKSQMNMSEKEVAESIDVKDWATIHRIINSNMSLVDKKRSITAFYVAGSCKELQKAIPGLECK